MCKSVHCILLDFLWKHCWNFSWAYFLVANRKKSISSQLVHKLSRKYYWNLLFYVLGLEVDNCFYFALIYELCGGSNNRTIHWLKHSSFSNSEKSNWEKQSGSQGGRTWQPFVGGKNGHENFRKARIHNFRDKCVVSARNRKFANLTK